jgi:hypothetical protein
VYTYFAAHRLQADNLSFVIHSHGATYGTAFNTALWAALSVSFS